MALFPFLKYSYRFYDFWMNNFWEVTCNKINSNTHTNKLQHGSLLLVHLQMRWMSIVQWNHSFHGYKGKAFKVNLVLFSCYSKNFGDSCSYPFFPSAHIGSTEASPSCRVLQKPRLAGSILKRPQPFHLYSLWLKRLCRPGVVCFFETGSLSCEYVMHVTSDH